jgi:hypothetical protein
MEGRAALPRQIHRMTEQCRRSAAMRSNSGRLMAAAFPFAVGAILEAQREQSRANAKQGFRPMNILRSEKVETNEIEVDGDDFAAASEVEAGIRDFVRNDIAYLRRPAQSAEPAVDSGAEATVNSLTSLIQRVAGASLSEIENLISELETLRDLLHA